MLYYLYQITNLVNNKIYIGVHKTSDINDGYMGSGKVIKRAIEKHGLENFQKDILEYFDDPESMYAREKEIVTDEFLLREDVYNLRRGGYGGFDAINKSGLGSCNLTNPEVWQKTLNSRLKRRENIGLTEAELNVGAQISKTKLAQVAEGVYNPGFKGKQHTDCTKEKMRASAKGKQAGSKNSQYGTMWITDGVRNRKIPKDSLIPENWYKGRK